MDELRVVAKVGGIALFDRLLNMLVIGHSIKILLAENPPF